MSTRTTIYVPLEDEGTDVLRPVEAERVGPETFRIVDSQPDDEMWKFSAGTVVRAVAWKFPDGSTCTVAAEAAEPTLIAGLSHITSSVRDLARSFAFYVEMLGCGPLARWPKGAYLMAGNVWLALVVEDVTRNGPLPEYTHIAFRVGEAAFARIAARIRDAGTTIFQDNETEGDSLYFLDPDGHKLEIHVGDLDSRLASAKQKPWPGLELFV